MVGGQARYGRAYAAAKRLLDIFGAAFGLVILSPLWLTVAVLIKLDTPGPVLYRRTVLGRGGQTFQALKFRTMVADADEMLARNPDLRRQFELRFKLTNDPRITRVGAFLRRSSLDELPQLLNVLRGEMSLVGPRIISPQEREKYGPLGEKLLTVKPGVTGLWQVSGRQELSYEERVRLDMWYIDHQSLGLDARILLKTPLAVFRRTGAY